MTRKFSAFGTQTGAGVDSAADYLPIIDASVADASKNKKILVSELAIPITAGTLPLSGGTLTGALTLAGDPASDLQAVTKQYADGLALNLGKRQTVRAATTANIVISTGLNSGDVIDGVTLATSDLVLVKNQSTPAQNGIYVVEVSPTRSVEFDTYDEYPGSLIAVQEGTANADTIWLCTSNAGGTLNTTAIVFSLSSTSGGTTYSAGTGLTLTGHTFSIDGSIVGRLATANTWALAQTFTVAPVFTDASGTRTALGLGTSATHAATDFGQLATTNTWALAQTFTVAPIFTDASGTRTALGLGTAATSASTAFQAADAQLFSNIPQNSKSAAYTTVLTDGEKHIFHPAADTTARTFTIDSNANVAYPIGTAISFVNQNSAGVVTIAITTDTMRLAGAGTTGSRTLAANGIATALKVTSTEWIISGTGLT